MVDNTKSKRPIALDTTGKLGNYLRGKYTPNYLNYAAENLRMAGSWASLTRLCSKCTIDHILIYEERSTPRIDSSVVRARDCRSLGRVFDPRSVLGFTFWSFRVARRYIYRINCSKLSLGRGYHRWGSVFIFFLRGEKPIRGNAIFLRLKIRHRESIAWLSLNLAIRQV